MSNKKSRRYEEQASAVRQRLNGRDYVLGLDLGVGSIGLAVVAQETINDTLYPTDIVFTTSRIFTPSKGAADRRLSRGQRNALRHKRHRLQYLWKLLAERQLMLPYSEEETPDPAVLRFSEEVRRENPYDLRLKGLKERLTLAETGYAIYHIANHRGSSSIRTFLDEKESAEEKKAKEQERKAEEIAKTKGLSTFIEVITAFNNESLVGYRNIKKRMDAAVPMPTRDIILNELNKLLKTQQQFYPELDDAYCDKIRNAVMYENEKIVPEAGTCPYFPNEQKLPKCHFLNEERRLWEALNNARVWMPVQIPGQRIVRREERPFTDEERKVFFTHLRDGENLNVTLVKKIFPKYKTADQILLQGKVKDKQEIKGFRFKTLENRAFWKRFSEDQQDDFFTTWTNTPDDEKLKRVLESPRFGLSEQEADDALNTVQLIGDYAPIGKTAMMLIMKHLEDGATYTEAIQQCVDDGELQEQTSKEVFGRLPYYGQVVPYTTQAIMGKAWHSAFRDKVDTSSFTKPDVNFLEQKYGRIANPVVHQTLNELRKVVNEVLDVMGKKPSEVVVEMGRELKVGAERREEISMEQSKREKESERIFSSYCLPNNLPKSYIQTFRLWEQQNKVCPYCLDPISVDDIVNHRVDIDHILPQADTAESREQNKVVAHKHCNLEKEKRTPYAAFSGKDNWKEIMQYVQTTDGMKGKAWRFELDDDAYQKYLGSKGFLSRFGTDNSYIAKVAQQYLACLFDKPIRVRTLKGGETALLRNGWHLQRVDNELADLHGPKPEETELGKKDRTDNRHHSLDAIVAAYCTRSYVKLINTMHAQGKTAQEILDALPVPHYLDRSDLCHADQINLFQKQVYSFLHDYGFVSQKIDNQVNGTLLKATRYSVIATSGDDLVCVVKKRVSDLKVKDGTIEEIRKGVNGKFVFSPKKFPAFVNQIKEMQDWNARVLTQYEQTLDKARQVLEQTNEEANAQGKRMIAITPVSVSKKALQLCGGYYFLLSNNSRKKVFVTKEPTANGNGEAFDTGNNLCLDLYHDANGKLQGEVIRKVYAMNPDYQPTYKKAGYRLFERLYQGDILEINQVPPKVGEAWGKLEIASFAPVGNATRHRRFVQIQTFTEVGNGIPIYISNVAKAHNGQDASFNVGVMGKYCPRKVSLSPVGFVNFVSPLLQDEEP